MAENEDIISSEKENVSPQKCTSEGFFDSDKLRLVSFFNSNPTLWDNKSGKEGKKEKEKATTRLVETFEYKYTATELFAMWKSLRSSFLRELKREKENKTQSKWKFYNAMAFLKPPFELKTDEWSDEEKRVVINFYNKNQSLWNHKLKDYHDKCRRQVLLLKREERLEGKYTSKEIVAVWNKLKTYYEKENMREVGSKKTGTGTDKVYKSTWKFFEEMSFVHDASIEADTPRSTLGIDLGLSSSPANQSETTPKKRRSNTSDELAQKRSLVYDAALAFMKQPASTPEPTKTDDDRFGDYVASQLRCMDAKDKLVIKARINNLFFQKQLNDQQQASYQQHAPMQHCLFPPNFNCGLLNDN